MSELKASRELDLLIAERVMGWQWARSPVDFSLAILVPLKDCAWQELQGDETRYTDFYNVPRYSESIADAWEVLPKMLERGWTFGITQVDTTQGWQYRVDAFHKATGDVDDTFSPSAPEAICVAALKSPL